MNNGKLRFVAGDGKQSPRQFALERVGKMNEENFYEGTDLLEDACQDCEQEFVLRHGKMCFHEGADGNIEEDAQTSEESLQKPQSCQQQRPQRPAEIAGDVYNKMLILRLLYQDLRNFDTGHSDQLADMIEETDILLFAMGRIYQTLSRSNRLPVQTFRKPPIRDFCNGLVTTSNFLRGLLADLRRLQRAVENQRIDTQLLIINITLMSHQQNLLQMRQDCR